MMLSYVPNRNKNVLLVITAHDQPIIDGDWRNKPEAILFYNEQRCRVDIVKQMLKDISSQPKLDDWTFSAFTFILDLATINEEIILTYNKPEVKKSRRELVASFISQLVAP